MTKKELARGVHGILLGVGVLLCYIAIAKSSPAVGLLGGLTVAVSFMPWEDILP